MPDMRGVFWARGPSFKKWKKVNWIKLVDEYQVLKKKISRKEIEPSIDFLLPFDRFSVMSLESKQSHTMAHGKITRLVNAGKKLTV